MIGGTQPITLVAKTRTPYSILRITMRGRCADTDGANGLVVFRDLFLSFFYGPGPNVDKCNPVPNTQSSKVSLVQTAATGFQAVVAGPLIANVFSRDWVNNGIFAQWIDSPDDLDLMVGSATLVGTAPGGGGAAAAAGSGGVIPAGGYTTPTGDGGVGALGARLPLVNNVTVHKYTGMRGRSWGGKSWKPTCVPITFFLGDEMSAAGKAAWGPMKTPMYATITDGTVVMSPILVSARMSEFIVSPTVVTYAPLILPGLNPVTGITNPVINNVLGESRRRKEKHGLAF